MQNFQFCQSSKLSDWPGLALRLLLLLLLVAAAGTEPVVGNGAAYLTEKMMDCQDDVKVFGKSTCVCIGYRYTSRQNFKAIRQDGLLTSKDRISAGNSNTRKLAAKVSDWYFNALFRQLGFGPTEDTCRTI